MELENVSQNLRTCCDKIASRYGAMPVSKDEEMMALCAIRYCIGRRSYIVSSGVEWARKYGAASPYVCDLVIRDIEEHLSRGERIPECRSDPTDEKSWREVLAYLKSL